MKAGNLKILGSLIQAKNDIPFDVSSSNSQARAQTRRPSISCGKSISANFLGLPVYNNEQ